MDERNAAIKVIGPSMMDLWVDVKFQFAPMPVETPEYSPLACTSLPEAMGWGVGNCQGVAIRSDGSAVRSVQQIICSTGCASQGFMVPDRWGW